MDTTVATLKDLYNRTPRRHNDENLKEIHSIVTSYEDCLLEIEAVNHFYENKLPPFFETVEAIKFQLKKSMDKKISKKTKDDYFDKASSQLKDSIEGLIQLTENGDKI